MTFARSWLARDMVSVQRGLPKVTAITLLFAVLVLGGCQQSAELGDPLLPIGFKESELPDVDLNAYVYAKQEQPWLLSAKQFNSGSEVAPDLPPQINVNHIAMIMGPSLDTFGGIVDFSSEKEASLISQLLQRQDRPPWANLSGGKFSFVVGEDEWSQSLKDALTQNRRAHLPQRFPEIWESVSLLPTKPPGRPVAAGFSRLDTPILESVATRAGIELGELTPALGFVKLSHVAFAVYAEHTLPLIERVDSAFISESLLGAILVGRSEYPGFIVSASLSMLGSRIGLETISLGDTDAKYLAMNDLHVIMKNKGSLILAAVSTDKAAAEALMKSALSR
ncbi:MAG: hypothetical protein HY666_00800 [Chloroflexi bacterium]|nr:hypothetical protein [Chloroflexota bacterium]